MGGLRASQRQPKRKDGGVEMEVAGQNETWTEKKQRTMVMVRSVMGP